MLNNIENHDDEEKLAVNQSELDPTAAKDGGSEIKDSSKEIDKLDDLKEQLKKEQEESKKNHELYLRALAEAENTRKRAAREREDYIKYAALPFIKKMLPVIDDLDRAVSMSEASNDYDALNKGVELITKRLHAVLDNEGVELIPALGEPFDPQYHQPLLVEENSEYAENTVIEELEKGYKMHDRVIRPSLVKVSK
ncbi:MAG: nucleotide exchange factor GrpE [Syntrophomonadaceae bacterium]|nr:nucleotide exchange factor GrpE [Syntrophomonadaceae bacterium]MDD3890310.1 nucleotide exchange factor GrpE [Syntrophomonadaceae bacterium]MDD4549476.1 nucleotide exchange factor GrpE [Syntrophomonadaceae bacterium]